MTALSKCKCAHHYIVPSTVVLIALVILLGNLDIITSHLSGILWPVGLAIIGFMKMCGKKCNCCCSCGCTGCQKDRSCSPSC